MSDAVEQEKQKKPFFSRLFEHLIKQLSVCLLIFLLLFALHRVPVPFLNDCAHAFGRAISWESDLSFMEDWYALIQERIPRL